ncbi:hypothetical protein [Salinicola aestuarinus]|uniref:hypothetical protein n=1 Tax=Salinicola aestuarinus TaxID=1949082 RepID=UPI001FD8CC96|nr:hypothetical protein [Salinicola aestuarinus]
MARAPRTATPPRLAADDAAFRDLLDPRMKWGVRRARWQAGLRDGVERGIGQPLEAWLYRWWATGRGDRVAAWGLPRRRLERELGESLTLEVDPRLLIRDFNAKGVGGKKPSSSAFIWDGDWDRSRGDLRRGSRYRFISDLDIHRDDLTQTERFQQLRSRLASGRPWSSYQQGLLLDTEAKIIAYLQTYLAFLDDMAVRGFDAERGKDELGVAVTRDGRLLKINRGLHRLAMAQRLGLPRVPVRVRAVHRQWWDQVTTGARGETALARVRAALPSCVPESEPGDLHPLADAGPFEWPAPRHAFVTDPPDGQT